ncbi:MAG TPA: hypothetical protein VNH18_23255, partial [Bryobacteraceae bacterium]|nr:hypothetical protein [Bryobacteraceae bacterium]
MTASADSKEVTYSYLSDGTAVADSVNACKLRRVGPAVAMAAGFVRANEFNALDYIRDTQRPGEQLHDLALRLLASLPERLRPAL